MMLVLLKFGIFFFLFIPTYPDSIKVTVQEGILIGARETTVFDRKSFYAFYGVPYARPPLGKLRFKDPMPAKKWNTFDASLVYHGACAQAHIVHKHGVYGYEDCLRLNIYTPFLPKYGQNELKPVIVWIHGYAFTSSFSHIYGPDFFIDNDILFISVAYRLGAFGFLKVNDSDNNANMGMKDIVIALKWIRRNIKNFGGDKNKITVMASGSGATLLSLLLTTKSSKLFSKVIMQSGGLYSPSIFQSNQNIEKQRLIHNLKQLGVQELGRASTSNVISASQKIYTHREMVDFQKPVVPFTPSVEIKSNKSLLTDFTEKIYKESQVLRTKQPIIIGFNTRESISEVIPFLHNPYLLNDFDTKFKYMVPFSAGCKFNYSSDLHKRIGEVIKEKYFKDNVSDKSVEDFLKFTTDLHKYPIYKFIKKLLLENSKIFIYKFDYIGKFNAVKATSLAGVKRKIKGTANGDELCYLFKCEPLRDDYVKISEQLNNRDKHFIKKLTGLWSNFAKTGYPTESQNEGNITWPPATVKENNMLYIGSNFKLIQNAKYENKMYEFWNNIYDSFYTTKHCQNAEHTEL